MAARRLRWQEATRLALRVTGLGLAATLLFILAGRVYPLAWPEALLLTGLGGTLAGLLAVMGYAWLRPRPTLAVARYLDRRLHLDERLSTAVELLDGRHSAPAEIAQAQLADAQQHLQGFDPARALPVRLPWRWLGITGALVMALAAGMLAPNPQVAVLQQRAQTQEILEEQAARLEEVRAELLADELLPDTPRGQELLQTLDELIAALRDGELSREEALAALSEAEQGLAALQDVAAGQTALLNDLAQTFSRFDSTESLAEALQERNLADAAQALTSAGADPEQGRELAEALQQAAQAARQAGQTDLADALSQAAGALERAATQGGDGQAAQEALAQAAEALAEAGEGLADQEAIAEALANIQSAREQLAQGNAPGGEGGGQSPGSGQGAGQAQGSGAVPGAGLNVGGAGREDPGPGAEGLLAEEGAPDQMSTGNGPNEGRVGEYESLYAPQHLGGEGGPVVNPDAPEVEGGLPLGDAPLDPNQDPGAALVPYDQVYGQYADEAGQALDSSYIPLGMKRYIRQYFGALEPEGN
ncbi:MAG: hypothetical protein ACE5H9_17000 [Anaerolineae bacterium]